MIEFLRAEEDVFAIRIAHRITGEDLDAALDRLEPMIDRYDKVHVFVETHAIDRIEVAGLARYVMRALPLIGKLGHLGRIAVVADQAWVRVGSRVKSAFLPFVSYKAHPPQQRDDALAWVRGKRVEPVPESLSS